MLQHLPLGVGVIHLSEALWVQSSFYFTNTFEVLLLLKSRVQL